MSGIVVRFRLPFPGFTLDTDLQLPARGVTALFGHSGSGKTTLLRCIAGLERAPQGFLKMRGKLWQDSAQNYFLPTCKRPLGYVFQEASLFTHMNVSENLEYGRKRSKAVRNPRGLDRAIELLGIDHLLERMPDRLSGGERQRVAIARALAVCPEVLLMDEPLAALDMQRKQEILPFLTRLHKELAIPVLYVTHSPQEVTRLADHLVVLKDGKAIISDTLDVALTRLDNPMTLSRQASSVVQVEVCGHESQYRLTRFCFAGGELTLPYPLMTTTGTKMRLRIYARDVSLSLQRPEQTSILNILPAVVSGLVDGEDGQTVVRLDVGGAPLLAHVTLKSATLLGLHEGTAKLF